MKKIFITGGAGYVGSVLTPYLLKKGYEITVLDLMLYGDTLNKDKNLNIIKGDIRDKQLLNKMGYNSNNYVVFLDPMWSGPLYKMHKVIDLKYGEINVIDFIKNN